MASTSNILQNGLVSKAANQIFVFSTLDGPNPRGKKSNKARHNLRSPEGCID